jgi:NarL family two-component system sensor histidine kinase YdfH
VVIGESDKWFWPYVIGQGILAFVITQLSYNIGMILALYMGLIGETIGMGQNKRNRYIAVIFLSILLIANYILLAGVDFSYWWLAGIVPIFIFVVLYVSLYTREIEARTQAQKLLEELETAHNQLAEYAAQVEKMTLENERQRMARELHDTLAQGLAGLILQLEAVDSHLGNNRNEKAQTIIRQAMTRARSTLADARRAISNLRETPSTPADLLGAIRAESDRFTHTTGIPCTLGLCEPPSLPLAVSENALRAVSEGLMNIARHAEATEVTITMRCDDRNLWVEISDNGVGFDPAEIVGRSGHYGLLGIRERARLLKGSLTIESQPSQGTTLTIQLPLTV